MPQRHEEGSPQGEGECNGAARGAEQSGGRTDLFITMRGLTQPLADFRELPERL